MENWEVVRDFSHQNTTEWTIQIIMVIREYIIKEGYRSISDSCGTGIQWKKLITVHNIPKCVCQIMCLRIKQVNIEVTHQIYQLIFHTQLFQYTCKCCIKIHHICVWSYIYYSNYYILSCHSYIFIYFNKNSIYSLKVTISLRTVYSIESFFIHGNSSTTLFFSVFFHHIVPFNIKQSKVIIFQPCLCYTKE